MNVEYFLLRRGIRTYSYPVITEITANIEIKIGDSLSTQLGWIYGISAEINGVTPKDPSILLPTAVQSGGLYLNLQWGQTWYISDLRMSNLIFQDPTSAQFPNNTNRYYPVNIPYTTDLKQSIIRNPNSLSGFSTMITFRYIPIQTYQELVKANIIMNDDKGIQ